MVNQIECPYCHNQIVPEVKKGPLSTGQIIAVIFLVITCFPFAFLVLFANRPEIKSCPSCKMKLQ